MSSEPIPEVFPALPHSEPVNGEPHHEPDSDEGSPVHIRSTARSLLRYAGSWVGDDLQESLAEVYAARGKAEF